MTVVRRPRWQSNVLAGVLVTCLVAAAALSFSALTSRLRVAALERIEAQLGHKLSYRSLETTLFSGLTFLFYDVTLSSSAALPQVQLSRVEVRFRLLRALASFGDQLEVKELLVSGGVLRVRRDGDGRTDLLEVLLRLPPPEPFLVRAGVVERIRVEGLRIEMDDDLLARSVVLDDVTLDAEDVRAGRPFDAQARFRWEGAGATGSMSMHMDAVPMDLLFWPLPPGRALLALHRVDLAALVTTLDLPPLLASGDVDATVFFEVPKEGELEAAVFAHGAATALPGEEPRPVSLDAALTLDTGSGRLEIGRFTFVGAGVDASATLQGRLSPEPVVDELRLDLGTDDLGLPMRWTLTALKATPGAVVLAGPGRFSLHVEGERVQAQLELDDARFQIGEAFHKRPGDSMRMHFAGGVTTDGIDGKLSADMPRSARVTGTLALSPAGADVLLVDLESNRVRIKDVVRLSPVLADVLGGTRQDGSIRISMRGAFAARSSSSDFHFSGADMNVVQDTTALTGVALVNLGVHTSDQGLAFTLRGDLTQLDITTRDAQRSAALQKRAGVPLRFSASLREAGGAGAIGRALAAAPSPAAYESPSAPPPQGSWMVGDALAPRWRALFLGLDGHGAIAIEELQVAAVALRDVDVRVSMRRGMFRLDPATLTVFGGQVVASSSTLDLRGEQPRYDLRLSADRIDLRDLATMSPALSGVAEGEISLQMAVTSSGLSFRTLLASLDGPVSITTRGVRISAPQLVLAALSTVSNALAGMPGLDGTSLFAPGLFVTLFDDEVIELKLDGRSLELNEPLLVTTGFGPLVLDGHASLDSTLDLSAVLTLTSPTLLRLIGAPEDAGIPVSMKVSGTWAEPHFHGLDTSALEQRISSALLPHAERQAYENEAEAIDAAAPDENNITDAQSLSAKLNDGTRAVYTAVQQTLSSLASAMDAELRLLGASWFPAEDAPPADEPAAPGDEDAPVPAAAP